MADVFSKKKRSEVMSRVRSKGNRATEGKVIELLRENRIFGWRRNVPLFGRPDIVFPANKVSIFVDGCFWHGCPRHGENPVTNREFWRRKLARNKARDTLVNRKLRLKGWTVLRIWQHELKQPQRIASRILRVLGRPV